MTVNMQFKQMGPFIQKLREFTETNTNKLPVKDLTTLLDNNFELISDTSLQIKEQVTLNRAFFKIKDRITMTIKEDDDTANELLGLIRGLQLFKKARNNKTIQTILQNCKGRLEEVDLFDKFTISKEVLTQIVKLHPNLHSLSLPNLREIDKETFAQLKDLKQLKSLTIDDFGKLPGDAMIPEVISQIPSLEVLDLGSCEKVTIEGVNSLINLKKLKKLTVSEVNVSEKQLEQFGSDFESKVGHELDLTLQD